MTQQDTYIQAGPTAVRAVRSAKSSSFLTMMGLAAKRMIPDHENLRRRTETDIIDVLAECPWSATTEQSGGSEHRPGN